jgi:hypothetical protein
MTPLARLLLLVAALGLALAATGCGNKEDVVTQADTEGIYVDVGELAYQVQISRALNPSDPEDRTYLAGLPPDRRELAPDETWFGVFVRVENTGEEARPAAVDFQIEDTAEQIYRPVPLADTNPFRYEARTIAPDEAIPEQDTAAATGPIEGSLLLFKVKTFSLQNRPLELHIQGPSVPQETATVDLDV